ncbi:MAG: zinc-dependent peptidase [Gammaproteobacteria bacterium]|nr:zinc-dependent peptidase [Gammaproteobacteria bacterium]
MSDFVLALLFLGALALPFWWFHYRIQWRRAAVAKREFPLDWELCLRQNWPLYWRLPATDRRRLQILIQQFIDEKQFFGCDGFSITEDSKVLIAAQACLLLLNKSLDDFTALQAVLVYPGAFAQPLSRPDEAGVVRTRREVRLGESWGNGRVVLSFDDVLAGLSDEAAHNVVLHEFAHQLDQADGVSDGTPALGSRAQVARWVQVFRREYERLRAEAWYGLPGALDSYGAESPAEFFAVASETFFTRPHELSAHSPALFEELCRFYARDPRVWQAR